MAAEDPIDTIQAHLRELYPQLDARGLGVTGRILRVAAHLTATRNRELRSFGLTMGDFDVLATVRRRGRENGINPRDLQNSVMITSGGLTKRLDRLQAAGLLARHPDPEDRRGVLITLTNEGRRVSDEAIARIITAETSLLDDAAGSERDRQRLEALLRRLLLQMDQTRA